MHPHVLPIVEGVLDPGCLISSLSSITILPGETAQPIHADDQLIPIPKPHPPTVCNSMWALTDFTEANGATRIVPGSHSADHSPDYGKPYDSIAAEMPKGCVLIWHGSLWHGGGANTTDERRIGIAMNYCAGYIRQQENQQLGLAARDGRRRFSPRLRELVGYGVYNMLIGHINKQSPDELLLDRAERPTPRRRWCGTGSERARVVDDARRCARAHAQPARRAERLQQRAVPRGRRRVRRGEPSATTSRASCSPVPAARSPRARTSARWPRSTRRARAERRRSRAGLPAIHRHRRRVRRSRSSPRSTASASASA